MHESLLNKNTKRKITSRLVKFSREATHMRLPNPYREELAIVRRNVAAASAALDWPRLIDAARPRVNAVRENPPPFWAMESLLKEYPISKPEGLALMRLAEALLRVPDSATAIALTADQLGRANFDGTGDGAMARLSNSVIARSKKTLPDAAHPPGILGKRGAKPVRVYEVLHDVAPDGPPGPMGDGTFIKRFAPKQEKAAADFAAANTYYVKPAKVQTTDAPRRLARRWGVA